MPWSSSWSRGRIIGPNHSHHPHALLYYASIRSYALQAKQAHKQAQASTSKHEQAQAPSSQLSPASYLSYPTYPVSRCFRPSIHSSSYQLPNSYLPFRCRYHLLRHISPLYMWQKSFFCFININCQKYHTSQSNSPSLIFHRCCCSKSTRTTSQSDQNPALSPRSLIASLVSIRKSM